VNGLFMVIDEVILAIVGGLEINGFPVRMSQFGRDAMNGLRIV